MTRGAALDLAAPVGDIARWLVDVPSESGSETTLANAIEAALTACAHLTVVRDGDAVVARTTLGRARRVIIAGHIDTVPSSGNLPARVDDVAGEAVLWGLGSVDMKSGCAVALRLAQELVEPAWDVTWVFYDHEEVAAELNGLGRLVSRVPELLEADLAILGEPTAGRIEGGCNGTLRVEVRSSGRRAHSARAWTGSNAIHGLADALARLHAYVPAEVDVDGLVYREGLNAVGVTGGVATNVIPDEAVLTVNYRFSPDKTEEQALEAVRKVFAGYEITVTDSAPGARPGLTAEAVADFVRHVPGEPLPKYGWTDVARFGQLGIPAVNFGPGDPSLAHTSDESVPIAQIEECERILRAWLSGSPA